MPPSLPTTAQEEEEEEEEKSHHSNQRSQRTNIPSQFLEEETASYCIDQTDNNNNNTRSVMVSSGSGTATATGAGENYAEPSAAAATRVHASATTDGQVGRDEGGDGHSQQQKEKDQNEEDQEDLGDDMDPIPHPPVVLVHANPLNENDDGNEDVLVEDGPLQVVLPLETFAEDLHMKLGRANGNIYHRTKGKDGVHDGQVMVRLKKKRFIVLDYSIKPNRSDLQASSMNPHIRCPKGAGRTRCSVSGCKKVGVPVLLYDSEPDETPSLYLRSGLCFTCQRNLNEKRRTQRKKSSDGPSKTGAGAANAAASANAAGLAAGNGLYLFGSATEMAPTFGGQPSTKRLRYDASVSGPGATVAAAQAQAQAQAAAMSVMAAAASPYAHYATGYQQAIAAAASMAQPAAAATAAATALKAQQQQQQQQILQQQRQQQPQQGPVMTLQFPPPAPGTAPLKQASQGHGYAEIGIDLKLASQQAFEDTDRLLETVNRHRQQQQQQQMMMGGNAPPLPRHEMDELYNASFASVARSLFLLQQWKQAWDGAAAAAAFAGTDQYLANGHVRMSPHVTATVAPAPPVLPSPAAALLGTLHSSRLLAASTGGGTAPTAAPTGASAVSNEAMAAATALASVNPSSTAPAGSPLAAPPGTLKATGPGTAAATVGGSAGQPMNTDGNTAVEQDAARV
mmetsp:Transcript_24209/g.57270  ORF Transcript_24209/g.57270 Transcript_24209/m.57270 type:complete len:681 (+) Transcript_24209:580-2622(+)